MTDQRTVRQWLDALRAELGVDGLDLSGAEQRALLDLARVAAHASERVAAPLSTFLAGVAFADLAPDARARAIETVTRRLEATRPDTESPPGG